MSLNIQPPHPLSFKFPGDQHISQFDQSLQIMYEAMSQLLTGTIDFAVEWSMLDLLTRVYLDDLLSEIIGIGDDTWYAEQIAEFDEILGV